MEENKKSIKELSTLELKVLYQRGWLSRIDIRNIAELQHFYNEIEEELKRRKLNLQDGYDLSGRYFTLDHHNGKFVFKVISWVPVTQGILSEMAEEHHLSGFINATGFVTSMHDVHTREISRTLTNEHCDWQFNNRPYDMVVGTDDNGLIVSSRIFDDEEAEDERVFAEEISKEEYERFEKTLFELKLI